MPPKTAKYTKTSRKDLKGRVVYSSRSGACYVKCKKADGTFGMRREATQRGGEGEVPELKFDPTLKMYNFRHYLAMYGFLQSYQDKTSNPDIIIDNARLEPLRELVDRFAYDFENEITKIEDLDNHNKEKVLHIFRNNFFQLNQTEMVEHKIEHNIIIKLFEIYSFLINHITTTQPLQQILKDVYTYFVPLEISEISKAIYIYFSANTVMVDCNIDKVNFPSSNLQYSVHCDPVVYCSIDQILVGQNYKQKGIATDMVQYVVNLFDEREEINYIESDALNPISYHIMSKLGFNPKCVVNIEKGNQGEYVCNYSRDVGIEYLNQISINYDTRIKGAQLRSLTDEQKIFLESMYNIKKEDKVVGKKTGQADNPIYRLKGVKMRMMRRTTTLGGAQKRKSKKRP